MMKHECKPIAMADWADEVCSICRTSLALPPYNNLAEAIQRVRELHKQGTNNPNACSDPDCCGEYEEYEVCEGCHYEYPCQTIKALDGEQ